MYGYDEKPKYKHRSFIKQIVFYGVLTLVSIILQVWSGVLLFSLLCLAFVIIHIRNKDKIEGNLIKQGLYQYKRKKKEQHDLERERKDNFQKQMKEIEEAFEDEELDAELSLYEDDDEESET